MAFDPDAFLKGTPPEAAPTAPTEGGFDPDAFLAAPPQATSPAATKAPPEAPKKPAWERAKEIAARIAGGAGALGTNFLDAASFGAYSRARDLGYAGIDSAAHAIAGKSPGLVDATVGNDSQFNEAHPFAASTARGLGYLAPMGGPAALGEAATAAGRAAIEAAPVGVREALAAQPMTTALAKHALIGGVTTGGTTLAEDATAGAPLKAALADAGDAAISGAGVGAGFGAMSDALRPSSRLQKAAQDRVVKQAVSDIIGTKETGKAIDTDVKKMGRAIEPIRDELRTREGLAIADAAKNDPDAGLQMVKTKMRNITADRASDYAAVDKATGAVRSGDFVKHLEDSATALEGTGRGKDAAVAAEVRKAAGRIKRATEWGASGEPPVNRDAKYDDQYSVGQYLDLMDQIRRVPGQVSMADAEIARVESDPRFKGKGAAWNPDAIVPTTKLRGMVTDMQDTAYDNLGGINGTNAFKKAKQVAQVGEDFLRQHLDNAAATEPDAVARIRETNRRYNAYATMRTALETRVGKADTAEMKISPTTALEMGVGSAVAAAGSPVAAAAGFAGKRILPKVVASADRSISRAIADSGNAPLPSPGGSDRFRSARALAANQAKSAASQVTANPASVARLIQSARQGASRADLQAQAKKDDIPQEIADNIAEQRGL